MIKIEDDGNTIATGTLFLMTVQIQSLLRTIGNNFKEKLGEENAFYWNAALFKMAYLDEEQMRTVVDFWVIRDGDEIVDMKSFKELYEYLITEFDS